MERMKTCLVVEISAAKPHPKLAILADGNAVDICEQGRRENGVPIIFECIDGIGGGSSKSSGVSTYGQAETKYAICDGPPGAAVPKEILAIVEHHARRENMLVVKRTPFSQGEKRSL